MPEGYGTINVRKALKSELVELADKVAKSEGLAKVSLQGLIERMKKAYEDNTEL